MAVEITKKPIDEIELQTSKHDEDIFDILDRIPSGVINGFFIFTALYMLYHLTMFCLRAVGAGY